LIAVSLGLKECGRMVACMCRQTDRLWKEVAVNKSIRVACVLFVAGLAILMGACNTTKGFGKDIEKAGDSIENSADKHGAD